MSFPLVYCLFMLTCFGQKQMKLDPKSNCLIYDAPSDGLVSSDSQSLICHGFPEFLPTSFGKPLLNTLVIQKAFFKSQTEYTFERFNVMSAVLDTCTSNMTIKPENLQNYNNIFNSFTRETLRFLTVINSNFVENPNVPDVSLDLWTTLSQFPNFEAIYFDNCTLDYLPEQFQSVRAERLHTLVIQNSGLKNIHLNSFDAQKRATLKRLILSGNQIANLNWLISGEPFDVLYHLDLSGNQINFIPKYLKSIFLPHIQVLHLANNRFFHFTTNTLSVSYILLQEFSLAPTEAGSTSLYFTEQLEKVFNEFANFHSSPYPLYFFEGFLHQFDYICDKNTKLKYSQIYPDLGKSFSSNDCELLKQVPIPFAIEDTFLIEKSNQKHFFLNGITLDSSQWTPGLSFNDQENLESLLYNTANPGYFQSVIHFADILKNMKTDVNTIRITLFGPRFAQIIFNNEPLSDETATFVQMLTYLVVDLLDEIRRAKMYAIFVLWKYEDIFKNENINLDKAAKMFKRSLYTTFSDILRPLLVRIVSDPTLLGIELVDSFLPSKFITGTSQPNAVDNQCKFDQTVLAQIQKPLVLLNGFAKFINPGSKLLGVSIEANCELCFQLFTSEECRKTDTVPQLSFLTLLSVYTQSTEERYGYNHWEENGKKLFPPTMALFYVLEIDADNKPEDSKIKEILGNTSKFASAVFINYKKH